MALRAQPVQGQLQLAPVVQVLLVEVGVELTPKPRSEALISANISVTPSTRNTSCGLVVGQVEHVRPGRQDRAAISAMYAPP